MKKIIKFIYSEKTTLFCEIFPLLLTVCTVKSKGKIFQNFVAFSEYMNFKWRDRKTHETMPSHDIHFVIRKGFSLLRKNL